MANTEDSRTAGRLIIGGFVLAIVILAVAFALNYGGFMPGDSAVLPPGDVSLEPGTQN